jgi:hypothetical protein
VERRDDVALFEVVVRVQVRHDTSLLRWLGAVQCRNLSNGQSIAVELTPTRAYRFNMLHLHSWNFGLRAPTAVAGGDKTQWKMGVSCNEEGQVNQIFLRTLVQKRADAFVVS